MTVEFWRGRRVLLTGNTGFKGAWLSLWLNELGALVRGYSLPPPTSPSLFELAHVASDSAWVEGDVRDRNRLRGEFHQWKPEVVFHLAAQPLVRASYDDPVATFETNVIGTLNVLESSRQQASVRVAVVVTSDKCYENQEWVWPYREDDRLGGHDPYSSSKACAEILAASYRRSLLAEHGLASATARAGNVVGGGDWARDRLVPDVVSALIAAKPAVIRNPASVRPWQHVLEALAGYLLLAERLYADKASFSEAWNFGPSAEAVQPVSTVADEVCQLWGDGASWTHEATLGPHEARILTLDSAKARSRLGWRPKLDYRESIRWTVEWYKSVSRGVDARAETLRQIRRYEELAS